MSAKGVFIFVAGVAVGAFGMYFGLKNYFKAQEEAKVNEALNRIDKSKAAKEPEPEVATSEPEAKEGPNLDIYKSVLEKKNYSAVSEVEKAKTMTEAVAEEVKEVIEKKAPAKKGKTPKKITQEEFDSTEKDRKIYLTYYADDILADEYDNKYDPVEFLGATNFKSFKSTYDTMYVFNFSTGMAMEVTHSNSFFRDISGGSDD